MNNGKICVPVCAATADEFIAEMKHAAEFADVIELRFDYLDEIRPDVLWAQINEFGKTFSGKLLATYRPKEQGGKRRLTPKKRSEFWGGSAIDEFVDWSDFEHDLETGAAKGFLRTVNERIIWSFHDFHGVPGNLPEIYSRLDALAEYESESGKSDCIKIALQTNDISDGLSLWTLLGRAEKGTFIPIAMGEAGKWTRIMGPAFGAPLTYAAQESGKENAPGQISIRDMIEVYRVKELTEQTKVYAIIGDPVSKSLSPFMHNAAFKQKGIDAVFMHMEVKDLDRFMTEFIPKSGLNFGGLAVTMPHKETIIPYLDEIDEVAKAIGAVNTVKFEGGKLLGYNTDAFGFIEPLKKAYGGLKDAKVAILGAGGAARACVYALKKEGAKPAVFARDTGKAQALADEFEIELQELPAPRLDGFDIVVNTTPLGMKPGQENFSLLTAEELAGVRLVYDLITKPAETALIRKAKKAEIPTVGGVEMLIGQGIRQFEIWTGREAPVDAMRAAALTRL